MELSIKKAFDLSNAVLEYANDIKPNKLIKISIYGSTDPKTAISNAKEKLLDQFNDVVELTNTYYSIKRIIGETNDAIGLTGLLRDNANNQALEKRLVAFHKAISPSEVVRNLYGGDISNVVEDESAVQDRIDLSRSRLQNKDVSGSIEDSFQVSAVPKQLAETIKNEYRSLQRKRMIISDQIAALNVNTKVVLPDTVVAVLTKHKLLQ